MGFLVKLDTNGTNLSMVKHLVDNNLIDYIAMDIKNSPEKYPITAKCSLPNIKEVVDYIMSCGIPYEFRTTLVDGHHTHEDMHSIANLIKGAENYYLQKFEDSGNCLASGLSPIDKSTVDEFCTILKSNIKNIHLRGY